MLYEVIETDQVVEDKPNRLIAKLKEQGFPKCPITSSCECFYFIDLDYVRYEFDFCDRDKSFTIEISRDCVILLSEVYLKTDDDWQRVLAWFKFLEGAEQYY